MEAILKTKSLVEMKFLGAKGKQTKAIEDNGGQSNG